MRVLFVSILIALAHSLSAQRVVLFEEYTSMSAPPAAPANVAFDQLMNANGDSVCVIKYHMFWPGSDIFNLYNPTENNDRRVYYSVNAVPDTRANGTHFSGHPLSVTQPLIDSLYALSPLVEINIPSITIDTPDLSFAVEVTALQAIPSHKVRVALIEDVRTYSTAPGTNGETTFRWIMRDMIPDSDGYSQGAATAQSTSTININYSYDDVELDYEDLSIIVFVQDDNTKEVLGTYRYNLEAITQPVCFIPTPELCIVSADSSNENNRIVWEKTDEYAEMIVARESSTTNQFNIIGTVPYDSLSLFIDTSVNVSQQAYIYAIAGIDTCGDTTDYSIPHKSLHLQVNLGVNNNLNLSWNHYVGNFVPSTYRIYRDSNNGPLQLIDSISGNQNSYTDVNVPVGLVNYMVEVIHPTGCSPTNRDNEVLSSRSNIFNIESPVGNEEIVDNHLMIFPNPVNLGQPFNLQQMHNFDQLAIYAVDGRLINTWNTGQMPNEITLKESGVFLLEARKEGQTIHQKLIVQ